MSESKKICPVFICRRKPGEQHNPECPRSAEKTRGLSLAREVNKKARRIPRNRLHPFAREQIQRLRSSE